MKRMLCAVILFLSSCTVTPMASYEDDNLKDYEPYFISLEQCLKQESASYYLYFFSPFCHLCADIKSDVLIYAAAYGNLFVLSTDAKIASNDNPYASMGKTNYESLTIAGYPTLMLVAQQKISVVYYGVKEVKSALSIK